MRLIPDFLRGPAARWLVVVGLAVPAAAFAVWRASNHHARYVTAAVTRGTIQRSISTTGALNPVVTVQVGSYVSGTVKKLFCDYNTEVVVGQPCALVDPVPFQLIVDQDRAQVGTEQAQLTKDQAALTYAKLAYERDSKLLDQGTVSQDTVDSEKSAYDQAVAQVGFDKATIVEKQAALKAAEVNLAYTMIVSPVVGTVITRSIDVGQTVAASLQTPTLFIIGKDLTRMQVDTNVSEADVGGIQIGQDASFSVQAFPGRTFHGTVTQIRRGPITVQNVVTYDIVIAFDNPNRLLFPGMTADTHIVTDEHRNVLRVPLPATRFSPEGIGRAQTPAAGAAVKAENAASVTPAPGEEGAFPKKRDRGGEGGGGERRFGGRERGGDGSERSAEGGGSGGSFGGGRGPGSGEGQRLHARRGAGGQPGRVWLLVNGKLKPVAVTLGLDDGAFIEVSSPDLKPGDTIVVNQISEREDKRAPTPGPGALRQGGPRL